MSRHHKFFMQALGEDLYADLVKWSQSPSRRARGSFSFYTANYYFSGTVQEMARKRKSAQTGEHNETQPASEALVWINVRLDADEIAWITELSANHDQIGARLASFLTQGVGFSVKFNPLRGNYSAFLIGIELDGQGKNCGISAFAPDALTATCACLAKASLAIADPNRGTASGSSVGIG